MKVVHISTGLTPVPPEKAAGMEEIVYQLTDHLGHLGCQVSVIDIKGGEYQKEKRQKSSATFYKVWRPPLPRKYNSPFLQHFFSYLLLMLKLSLFALPASLALIRLFRREKIEVIHAHGCSLPALAAMMVNKLRRNPAVTIYSTYSAFGLTKLTWRKKLPSFHEITALKWADHTVGLSPGHERWLASEFNLDPAKITQIFEGVNLEEVEQFLSHKAGACHQSNMVLCPASVGARKNQLSAVKAIPQVVAVHPEVKFVFAGGIGQAKYFNSIQSFIAENNLSPWVEFKGEVSRHELYNLYSEAILFLLPTMAEGGSALVLLEALAFGLPVIVSTIEENVDVVSQEEGSAILVDPYDVDGIAAAIIQVLDDSALRQSMSQKAKKLAENFSWQHIASQTLAMYNKLVQNKKHHLDK